MDYTAVIDAGLVFSDLCLDHLGCHLLDVVGVTRDLAVAIGEVFGGLLDLVGEEFVKLIILENLLIVLCCVEFFGSVPLSHGGFPGEDPGSGSVPPLDEAVPLLNLNNLPVVPSEVFTDGVVVLDIIDIDLLILEDTLEH